jgi:hypothetical protein
MNTRRYPRTTKEAFADERASTGDWVSMPRRKVHVKYDFESAGHRCVLIVSIVGVVGFLLWALLGALT